jgi:hypothetical protein
MDIEIRPQDPTKPEVGIITIQRIIPAKGIEGVRDDLLRNPGRASESTKDDSPESLYE